MQRADPGKPFLADPGWLLQSAEAYYEGTAKHS